MKQSKLATKDLTYIAIGIAALLSGGFMILQLSLIFPIPGIKYIFMAPFISLVFFLLTNRIKASYGFILIGFVFALIMGLFNIYMTIAITVTAILTQITVLPINKKMLSNIIGSALFSTYMGLSALFVSKYFIGGVFSTISIKWIWITAAICTLFGGLGVHLAMNVNKYIRANHKTP